MLDNFSGDYVGPRCAIVAGLGYCGASINKAGEGGCACAERDLCKLFYHLIGMNYRQLQLTLLGLYRCKMKENT